MPGGLGGARSKERQNSSGSGAEIEKATERIAASHLDHGGLDIRLAHMQRAQSFPVLGIGAEIGGSILSALAANLFHPGEITDEHRIRAGEQVDDRPGQSGATRVLAETEKHPTAFLVARKKPSLGHQLKVAAHPGLALSQYLGQLTDVEFAMGEDE